MQFISAWVLSPCWVIWAYRVPKVWWAKSDCFTRASGETDCYIPFVVTWVLSACWVICTYRIPNVWDAVSACFTLASGETKCSLLRNDKVGCSSSEDRKALLELPKAPWFCEGDMVLGGSSYACVYICKWSSQLCSTGSPGQYNLWSADDLGPFVIS